MIRVNMIHESEMFKLEDKNGVVRQIKLFESHGNIYMGPVHALFDRTYVMKDKNRINFVSKIDLKQNELMHVSVILEKIEEHKHYSYYTKDMIINFLKERGYTEEDIALKPKIYSTAKEMFIEYGFNSMNFCLDRRGDIWVHYKSYEEKKQHMDILAHIKTEEEKIEFEKMYKRLFRFVRYTNMDDENNIKCFALKSINITKLYFWLSEQQLIHKVNYVSDIYNETLREIAFHNVKVDDPYIKVIIDNDGARLKNNSNENNNDSNKSLAIY